MYCKYFMTWRFLELNENSVGGRIPLFIVKWQTTLFHKIILTFLRVHEGNKQSMNSLKL